MSKFDDKLIKLEKDVEDFLNMKEVLTERLNLLVKFSHDHGNPLHIHIKLESIRSKIESMIQVM